MGESGDTLRLELTLGAHDSGARPGPELAVSDRGGAEHTAVPHSVHPLRLALRPRGKYRGRGRAGPDPGSREEEETRAAALWGQRAGQRAFPGRQQQLRGVRGNSPPERGRALESGCGSQPCAPQAEPAGPKAGRLLTPGGGRSVAPPLGNADSLTVRRVRGRRTSLETDRPRPHSSTSQTRGITRVFQSGGSGALGNCGARGPRGPSPRTLNPPLPETRPGL